MNHPSNDHDIRIVVDYFAKRILNGMLGTGDPLPSYKEVAQEFLITEHKVTLAMHTLEEMGLITLTSGKKPEVADFQESGHVHLINQLFKEPTNHPLKHILILELEGLLDETIHAASKLNAATLRPVKVQLESMLQDTQRGTEEEQIYTYYLELATSSGRPMLKWTLNELAPTLKKGFAGLSDTTERYHGTIRLLMTQLHHIVQGNEDKALAVQTSLFQRVHQYLDHHEH